MWTRVLLCLAVVLTVTVKPAPTNLPQTISCPDDKIYVFVNQSILDRSPYIFVEVHADNLQECIHKCFGNQFCFSLKYESAAVNSCSLYYFASSNCSTHELLLASEIQYHGGALVIDCLKCPANGDFVTAPPFLTVTDQPIKVKNLDGHALHSTPLVNEVTNSKGSELEGNSSLSSLPSTQTGEPHESKEKLSTGVPKDELDFHMDFTPTERILSSTTITPHYTTLYPACIINFQLDANTDISSFKHYEVVKVRSVNDCARICYGGRCSAAVYSPLNGECRLGVESKESCSNVPSTIYYRKQEDIKIQCFRCSSPKRFIKEHGREDEKKSAVVLASHQVDQHNRSMHEDQPTPASTRINTDCLIKFQARQFSKRPPEFNAPFEIELLVDSVEHCAFRCYQDGCSGAKYDPTASSCALSYNDKQFCAKEDMMLHYKTDELTWIHCINCYTPTSTSVQSTIMPLKKEEERPTNTSSPFQRGCLIKFQASPITERPEQSSAPFESEIAVDSVEQCASHCYQDGCSGAKYEPMSRTCFLSYSDKQYCTKSPVVLHYNANSTTWIHCVNCYAAKGSGLIEFTALNEETATHEAINVDTRAQSTSAPPLTTSAQQLHTTAISDKFGEPLVLMANRSTNTTSDYQTGCVIHFQLVKLEELPSHLIPNFETSLTTETAEICAYRCYQDGCTGAKFMPERRTCFLSYDGKPYCSNSKLVTVSRVKESVIIHCLSCVPQSSDGSVDHSGNGFLLENIDVTPKNEENSSNIFSGPIASLNMSVTEAAVTQRSSKSREGSESNRSDENIENITASTESALEELETTLESSTLVTSSISESQEKTASLAKLPAAEGSGEESVETNQLMRVKAKINKTTTEPNQSLSDSGINLEDASSPAILDGEFATTFSLSSRYPAEHSKTMLELSMAGVTEATEEFAESKGTTIPSLTLPTIEGSGAELVEVDRTSKLEAKIEETLEATSQMPSDSATRVLIDEKMLTVTSLQSSESPAEQSTTMSEPSILSQTEADRGVTDSEGKMDETTDVTYQVSSGSSFGASTPSANNGEIGTSISTSMATTEASGELPESEGKTSPSSMSMEANMDETTTGVKYQVSSELSIAAPTPSANDSEIVMSTSKSMLTTTEASGELSEYGEKTATFSTTVEANMDETTTGVTYPVLLISARASTSSANDSEIVTSISTSMTTTEVSEEVPESEGKTATSSTTMESNMDETTTGVTYPVISESSVRASTSSANYSKIVTSTSKSTLTTTEASGELPESEGKTPTSSTTMAANMDETATGVTYPVLSESSVRASTPSANDSEIATSISTSTTTTEVSEEVPESEGKAATSSTSMEANGKEAVEDNKSKGTNTDETTTGVTYHVSSGSSIGASTPSANDNKVVTSKSKSMLTTTEASGELPKSEGKTTTSSTTMEAHMDETTTGVTYQVSSGSSIGASTPSANDSEIAASISTSITTIQASVEVPESEGKTATSSTTMESNMDETTTGVTYHVSSGSSIGASTPSANDSEIVMSISTSMTATEASEEVPEFEGKAATSSTSMEANGKEVVEDNESKGANTDETTTGVTYQVSSGSSVRASTPSANNGETETSISTSMTTTEASGELPESEKKTATSSTSMEANMDETTTGVTYQVSSGSSIGASTPSANDSEIAASISTSITTIQASVEVPESEGKTATSSTSMEANGKEVVEDNESKGANTDETTTGVTYLVSSGSSVRASTPSANNGETETSISTSMTTTEASGELPESEGKTATSSTSMEANMDETTTGVKYQVSSGLSIAAPTSSSDNGEIGTSTFESMLTTTKASEEVQDSKGKPASSTTIDANGKAFEGNKFLKVEANMDGTTTGVTYQVLSGSSTGISTPSANDSGIVASTSKSMLTTTDESEEVPESEEKLAYSAYSTTVEANGKEVLEGDKLKVGANMDETTIAGTFHTPLDESASTSPPLSGSKTEQTETTLQSSTLALEETTEEFANSKGKTPSSLTSPTKVNRKESIEPIMKVNMTQATPGAASQPSGPLSPSSRTDDMLNIPPPVLEYGSKSGSSRPAIIEGSGGVREIHERLTFSTTSSVITGSGEEPVGNDTLPKVETSLQNTTTGNPFNDSSEPPVRAPSFLATHDDNMLSTSSATFVFESEESSMAAESSTPTMSKVIEFDVKPTEPTKSLIVESKSSVEEPIKGNTLLKAEANMDQTSKAEESANRYSAGVESRLNLKSTTITHETFASTIPPFVTSSSNAQSSVFDHDIVSFGGNLPGISETSGEVVGKPSTKKVDNKSDSTDGTAIIKSEHKASLPVNVGFVPGSEPDSVGESGEEEEEINKMDAAKMEYEDFMTTKSLNSTTTGYMETVENITTTEPPIQLVQDLIDALAGGGLNAILGPPRSISESSEYSNNKLGELKKYIHMPVEQKQGVNAEITKEKEHVDITNLGEFSMDSSNAVVPPYEGTTSECDGRLEFQTLPIGTLPHLNITSDIPARTPADCAKKCFETKGCSMAAYITNPSGDISKGICLPTTNDNICGNNADYIPQHAALNPFLISCIRCSACTYNIRTVTPDRVLPNYSDVDSVSSIGECAKACYSRRCTMALYNSSQHSCAMTSMPFDSKCIRETAVITEGILPVTLECVNCSS